jgi:hypothetical protein
MLNKKKENKDQKNRKLWIQKRKNSKKEYPLIKINKNKQYRILQKTQKS